MVAPSLIQTQTKCYHCGEKCLDVDIQVKDKSFCCEGCRTVYFILNEHEMCQYYDLNENPGIKRNHRVWKDKFLFLENEEIAQQLILFQNETQTHVRFYLPHIHCSSCLWLLENIHRIEKGIVSSQVNFSKKEVSLIFYHGLVSLKQVAECLTSIGYEPYISLQHLQGNTQAIAPNKARIYKIGVAGFCFGNIMMMSFPEYFAGDGGFIEPEFQLLFRMLNFALSLPVLFYSGFEFFEAAYKGLKNRVLNIDLPIALALIVTFSRSCYEVFTGIGSGYFDSMTGIVFFMIVGRWLQDKTYHALSFDRDYKSFFPIAVTRIKGDKKEAVALSHIQKEDILLIHPDELIPADGIISKGRARIDYSFITGEGTPVEKQIGELVYAGGRQLAENIELLVTHEVSQSYLTEAWNNQRQASSKPSTPSFTHKYSQYFTLVLLSLVAITGVYWAIHDTTKLFPAMTAMLIVACPCALLLSATFTYGSILTQFAAHKFYIRNAEVLEQLARADMLVFDKTGTLTEAAAKDILYEGEGLSEREIAAILALTQQSLHPLSKELYQHLARKYPALAESLDALPVKHFQNFVGKGIEGQIADVWIKMGSAEFIFTENPPSSMKGTKVYLSMNGSYKGLFLLQQGYRQGILSQLKQLISSYKLVILSGDSDVEADFLSQTLGDKAVLKFHQKPEDKSRFIAEAQKSEKGVVMIGDGLNDAGALSQSDVGIAVSEHSYYFTPASDAILHADSLKHLPTFIDIAQKGKRIIQASFAVSILYNVVGLSFAIQGSLSPMIAAILMPASSLTIVFLTHGLTTWISYRKLAAQI